MFVCVCESYSAANQLGYASQIGTKRASGGALAESEWLLCAFARVECPREGRGAAAVQVRLFEARRLR